jgi:hypothetical protein
MTFRGVPDFRRSRCEHRKPQRFASVSDWHGGCYRCEQSVTGSSGLVVDDLTQFARFRMLGAQ